MATEEQIKAALDRLDPANHDHWTNTSAPRMDVLQDFTGDPQLTRKQVTQVAPNFSRDTAGKQLPDSPGVSEATEQGTVSPPLVEQAPSETDETDDREDQVDDAPTSEEGELTDLLAKADAELAQAEEFLNSRRKEVEKIRERRDQLVQQRDRAKTPHDDQVERMRFIRSQAEARAARAGEAALAKRMTLEAKGLASSSPLDQSMSSRPGRGQDRPPARPLKNTKPE